MSKTLQKGMVNLANPSTATPLGVSQSWDPKQKHPCGVPGMNTSTELDIGTLNC